MVQIPAHKRLRSLPEVFTTRTLAAVLNVEMKAASVYVNRWRKEEFISSLGPRVGVHFNILKNPDAEDDLRLDAISMVFPGAVIAGVSAVHAAGWTTQIPSAIEIMVPPRPTTPEIYGAVISTRPKDWFVLARQSVQRAGVIPMVDPAFALADIWHKNEWQPDPDDLEWDMIDEGRLRAAFRHFDLDIPDDWAGEMESSSPDF